MHRVSREVTDFFLFLGFTTCSLFYAKHATDDKTIHFFVISLDYTFSDNKREAAVTLFSQEKNLLLGKTILVSVKGKRDGVTMTNMEIYTALRWIFMRVHAFH